MADQLDQSIHCHLLKGNELSDSDIAVLRDDLVVKIDELQKIASSLSIRLTGSTCKKDIVDRIVGMAQIGAVRDSSGKENGEDVIAISYLTEEVKSFLKSLPSFSNVTQWSKKLSGILAEFTLISIIIYLVYGRDKTFDMQALRAHKSPKAYVETLWQHVIFSHQHAPTVVQEKFFVPGVAQCYDYLCDMTVSSDEVAKIEEATRGQGENDLWIVLRNGRITSSRLGEILHRRESTN